MFGLFQRLEPVIGKQGERRQQFDRKKYTGCLGPGDGEAFIQPFTNLRNTSFIFDNKVDIQGLWPMRVTSLVHANYYSLWGILGAAGIAVTAFMGRMSQKSRLALLVIPVLLADAGNHIYRRTIVEQNATVSSLYYYLRDDYTADDCMGFSLVGDSSERFDLYAYYLHGYELSQISLQQWQQAHCTGPYLTYALQTAQNAHLRLIGEAASTGLYVLAPKTEAVAVKHVDNKTEVLGVAFQPPLIFREHNMPPHPSFYECWA